MTLSIDRSFFDLARERIAEHVLRTPVVRLHAGPVVLQPGQTGRGLVSAPMADRRLPHDVQLKLECLQITGSFKARGAQNRVRALTKEIAARGIVTASGGNHGLAVAFAGCSLGIPTVVYLPETASVEKAGRIEGWGAEVIRGGQVWDDAHRVALAHAARDGLTYVHPFADPDIVAGQGTIALELFDQAPETDLLVIAIGGGGLAAGVASAARLLWPSIRVVGVEPVGAPTVHESLRAGRVVELATVTTRAGTLAPRATDPYTFSILRQVLDEIVLVTDEEMEDAARWLHRNAFVGVELSGAAAMAGLLTRKIALEGRRNPCVLVCGAGTDGAGG